MNFNNVYASYKHVDKYVIQIVLFCSANMTMF